jgi:membrane protein involved in colicin uptake
MSEAIDRFKERKADREILNGAVSDDLAKYLPLATGAVTELTVDQVRAREQANSEAGKAQAAAQAARKKAEMLKADSIADPSKSAAAAQAEKDAQAAEAKAAFYKTGSTSTAMIPSGAHGGGGMSTQTKILIGVGAAVALGGIFYFAKKR